VAPLYAHQSWREILTQRQRARVLARALLERARQDETHPMPVVFHPLIVGGKAPAAG
jgi:hypothetical protein